MAPLPAVTATKPGSARCGCRACAVIRALVVDEAGRIRSPTATAATWSSDKPWPAMLRGHIATTNGSRTPTGPGWQNRAVLRRRRRQKDTTGATLAPGPGGRRHKLSGHRLLPPRGEIESGLVSHPAVAEAVVSGQRRNDRTSHRGIRYTCAVMYRGRRHRGRPTFAKPRRQGNRPDRQAQDHLRGARTPKNSIPQNHAPTPPGHCRKGT